MSIKIAINAMLKMSLNFHALAISRLYVVATSI